MALRDVALVLGPVAFEGFEIPQRIEFGGDQVLALHDMQGGQRIIDVLGPRPADIGWSGAFAGPDATARARLLDTLRAEGGVLALSWDVFFFNVVIRSFKADYHSTAWVPYRLCVTVLQDTALALAQLTGDLGADALADAGQAGTFAALAGIGLAGVQTALSAPGALVLGTATHVAARAAVLAGQSTVQDGLDTADTTLGGYAAAGLHGGSDVGGMIGAAGSAAALAGSHAYLGRLGVNLANAGS